MPACRRGEKIFGFVRQITHGRRVRGTETTARAGWLAPFCFAALNPYRVEVLHRKSLEREHGFETSVRCAHPLTLRLARLTSFPSR